MESLFSFSATQIALDCALELLQKSNDFIKHRAALFPGSEQKLAMIMYPFRSP